MKLKKIDLSSFDLKWSIQDDYTGCAEDEARRIADTNTSMHGFAVTGKKCIVNNIIREN